MQLFYEKTGKIHLETSEVKTLFNDNKGLMSSNWHTIPKRVDLIMRRYYSDVLRENGLTYESKSNHLLRVLFPMLWGLAQHFRESGLILGERDSEHSLH